MPKLILDINKLYKKFEKQWFPAKEVPFGGDFLRWLIANDYKIIKKEDKDEKTD